MIPGEIFIKEGVVICNKGKKVTKLKVINTGDRPIQVGSHFHFFEVNKDMLFDREAAFGKRLNIISSTAVRFEPGEEREIELVDFAGRRNVYGFSNLVDGNLDSEEQKGVSLEKAKSLSFKTLKK